MNRAIVIVVVLVLGTYVTASSVYTVNEVEQIDHHPVRQTGR